MLTRLLAAAEERIWIDLRAPATNAEQRVLIPFVEFRGVAGAGKSLYHDLVIVLDLSVSTRLPSGVDVDGDGILGKSHPEIREDYWGSAAPEKLCDDREDTIAAAEIAAARRLLEILDPEITRVALVAFGDRGHLEAPIGSSRAELGRALDALDEKHGWYGGTNYASAVQQAVRALVEAPSEGLIRQRTILFLSDGFPTMPLPPESRPRNEAIAAARESRGAESRLHTFALGTEAIRGQEILSQMAELSYGHLEIIERPGDVLFHLPTIELSDVETLSIENRTTGQPGRGVRLFPDGSFDGFVPLQAGENVVRVTATGAGGGVGFLEREVVYLPEGSGDPSRAREVELRLEELRRVLRDRTIETEIVSQIKRKRRDERRRRELRIDVESGP